MPVGFGSIRAAELKSIPTCCRYVIEKKRFPECGSKDEQVGWFIGYFPLAALGGTVNKHYNHNLNL